MESGGAIRGLEGLPAGVYVLQADRSGSASSSDGTSRMKGQPTLPLFGIRESQEGVSRGSA